MRISPWIGQYILNADGDPVPCDNILEWGKWMETADRHVADDELDGGVRVSTVFLGLDHAFHGPPPILWETMVFGGPHDQYMDRYSSREAAIEGHKRVVQMASSPTAEVT